MCETSAGFLDLTGNLGAFWPLVTLDVASDARPGEEFYREGVMRFSLLCVNAAATLTLVVAGSASGGTFACAAGPTAQCNDVTSSLGQFIVQVNGPDRPAFAGVPGFDPTSGLFISPVLFDANTIIGRSAPLSEGTAADNNGVITGVAQTVGGVTVAPVMVKDPSSVPAGFERNSNDEVHTAVLNLDLTAGPFSVTAGASAPAGSFAAGKLNPGEVESLGCASIATGTPCNDFPANSFFDVFAEGQYPFGALS
jgi:hypothetical protein